MTAPSLLDASAEQLHELTRGWSAERKDAMLLWLQAQHTRRVIQRKYEHPAQLAQAVDPTYVMTPAIEAISRSVERTIREPQRNLLVTMPPQEGKSNLCAVWAPIRALQVNLDTRIILATYGDALAEDHSRATREIILTAGTGAVDAITGQPVEDKLGISLADARGSVSGWRIRGGKGGVKAVGLGSSITGRAADLMIIDDPYKNMQEADSASYRRKVSNWFKSVALTRLSPDASIILIQTRWHELDLAGEILAAEAKVPREQRSWRHINIPAVSEPGVPDELGREPGVAMVSARGRTAKQFYETRQKVGERVWFALYEGAPSPPEGGLFSRKWFENSRLAIAPPNPTYRVVGIDPAETGENDEVGIIAGSLYGDQTVVLTHDRSGRMTSDRWSRAAVELAVEIDANELAFEAYASQVTYNNVLKAAWKELRQETVVKHQAGHTLTDLERKILSSARMPFTIKAWRGKGDAVGRSSFLRQAVETGKVKMAGTAMTVMEDQAATWQQGQHQPDRVAAAIIVHDRLASRFGGGASFGNPMQTGPVGPAPTWLTRKVG